MGNETALALALEGRITARGDVADLVDLAGALASLPDPEIDPRFAAKLEARLLAEGLEKAQPEPGRLQVVSAIPATPADEIVRRAPVVQIPTGRMAVRRSVAAVAAAAMLSAFPVAAAGSALPGSPFYGLKEFGRWTQVQWFGTPLEDGFRKIEHAAAYAAETAQLANVSAKGSLIADTLEKVRRELNRGGRLVLDNTTSAETLTRLSKAARAVELQLGRTAAALAGRAAGELADAQQASRRIQRAVAAVLSGTSSAPAALTGGAPMSDSQPQQSAGRGAASADTTAHTSGGSESSDAPPPGRARRTLREEPTGRGKAIDDAGSECRVPGAANGLGDVTARAMDVACDPARTTIATL